MTSSKSRPGEGVPEGLDPRTVDEYVPWLEDAGVDPPEGRCRQVSTSLVGHGTYQLADGTFLGPRGVAEMEAMVLAIEKVIVFARHNTVEDIKGSAHVRLHNVHEATKELLGELVRLRHEC